MDRSRSLVRASELALWAYCRRAWWLARVQEVPHRDPAILARGQTSHERHGRQVGVARRLVVLGRGLVVIGLIGLGILLVVWIWGR